MIDYLNRELVKPRNSLTHQPKKKLFFPNSPNIFVVAFFFSRILFVSLVSVCCDAPSDKFIQKFFFSDDVTKVLDTHKISKCFRVHASLSYASMRTHVDYFNILRSLFVPIFNSYSLSLSTFLSENYRQYFIFTFFFVRQIYFLLVI